MYVNAACVRLYYMHEVTQIVENINIFVPIVVEKIVLDTIDDKHKITGCFIRCFMMRADGRVFFFLTSQVLTIKRLNLDPIIKVQNAYVNITGAKQICIIYMIC